MSNLQLASNAYLPSWHTTNVLSIFMYSMEECFKLDSHIIIQGLDFSIQMLLLQLIS